MPKINSTQKGESFERSAFEVLKEMLENDEFYVSGKKSRIFWKKEYYSPKRSGNIKFDITIETYLRHATDYSHLTIIECKNLGRKVTVDDIEEFSSKVSQVGEHNTKAIIISNTLLQVAAYNYAVSQKIGLILLKEQKEIEWINYRKEKSRLKVNPSELAQQFTSPEKGFAANFVANINGKGFLHLGDIIAELGIIDVYLQKEDEINLPFISDERIDDIVDRIARKDVYDGVMLNTDKLCSFLSKYYPVTFEFDKDMPNKVLGKIEFEPLKIFITKQLAADRNRWRFTLIHEAGHLILHAKLLKGKMNETADNDTTISFRQHLSNKFQRRVELQANIFASHLLLPKQPLTKMVNNYFIKERIHKGYLYLDNQPVNQVLVHTFLTRISEEFGVSIEVAKIRLIRLGLLQDDTDISLRKILNDKGLL